MNSLPCLNETVALCARRGLGTLVAITLAGWLAAVPARAATLTWDPLSTGAGSDGPGTWDNGTTSDWAATGALPDSTWANANGATTTAVFGEGGTAGTVG